MTDERVPDAAAPYAPAGGVGRSRCVGGRAGSGEDVAGAVSAPAEVAIGRDALVGVT